MNELTCIIVATRFFIVYLISIMSVFNMFELSIKVLFEEPKTITFPCNKHSKRDRTFLRPIPASADFAEFRRL